MAWETADEETPHWELEQAELAWELDKGIQALPPLYRESFVLRHVEGLGYDEMSAILGVHRDTLKMRVLQGAHAAVPIAGASGRCAPMSGEGIRHDRLGTARSAFHRPGALCRRARAIRRRLGRDEALRQRVIELEQLVLDVSRLPRPAVPDGFVARVMERTGAQAPDRRPPHRCALVAARAFSGTGERRRGRLSRVARCRGCGRRSSHWPLAVRAASGAVRQSTAVATATAPSTVLVRLVILQPGARTVQVAGDFNGWNPARTPLEQVSSGAWTVTIPLEARPLRIHVRRRRPQWIADPFAAEQSDDGFGSRNAVLDVRPPTESSL